MQQDIAVFLKKYFAETNVCERQGRCALGCIPGARHTNNKKIFDYLKSQTKKKHFDVYPLCEVYDIEPLPLALITIKFTIRIMVLEIGNRQVLTGMLVQNPINLMSDYLG